DPLRTGIGLGTRTHGYQIAGRPASLPGRRRPTAGRLAAHARGGEVNVTAFRRRGGPVTDPSSRSLIHQALLYEDAQQFLAAILPFIREGLDRGEPVLAVTTETNSSMLRGELGRA